MRNLLNLFYKSIVRSSNFGKYVLGFFLLFLLFLIVFYDNYTTVLNLRLLYKTIKTDELIVSMLFVFAISDFVFKFSFRKSTVSDPIYFKVLSFNIHTRRNFNCLLEAFSLWNFYFLVFTIPVLYYAESSTYFLLITLAQWLICLINSSLIKIIKSFLSLKRIQYAIIISLLYLALVYACSKYLYVPIGILIGILFILAIPLLYYTAKYLQGIYINSKGKSTVILFENREEISIFRLQLIAIFRSKRLIQSVFLSQIVFLILCYINYFERDTPPHLQFIFLNMFIIMPAMQMGQNILGIEANFFTGLLTKPLTISALLNNKFILYALLSVAMMIILLPLVFLGKINILILLSNTIYIIGFNLLLFINVLVSTKKLDLHASNFFNRQGFDFIPMVFSMLIFIFQIFLNVIIQSSFGEYAPLVLSAIGLALILVRKSVFALLSNIFAKMKYNYLNNINN